MKKLPPGLIIELLEKKFGLKVKKHAKTYSVRCPFHDDQKASALVFPDVNVFTCMVCGKKLKEKWGKISGKKIDHSPKRYYYIPAKAVAMLEGINKKAMSEKEWKDFLKEYENKNITQIQPVNKEEKNRKKHFQASDIWNLCKNYICPSSIKYLKSRNINGLDLYKKNLIRFIGKESSKRNSFLESMYKNEYKILIPLFDYSGKNIVNIQFRKINQSKETPKAKFLPGGTVTDFGLENINKNKLATFFVEGSTDYLSLKSLGYTNVIGLTNINSSFTNNEKINLLKKLPKIIFMFYDKDEPGINFMQEIKKQIKNLDNSKVFIPLHILSKTHQIKDINDFIKSVENPREKIDYSIIQTLQKIIKDKNKEPVLLNIQKLL